MERNKRLFVLKNIRKAQKHPDKIEALDDVINILGQKPNKDHISRSHLDERIRAAAGMVESELTEEEQGMVTQILAMLSTEPPVNIPEQQDWIPIKTRALTDEEKKEYGTEYEYMLDCPLPEDGEEILISIDKYVQKDTCYVDDSFYLDSGYDWIEVDAWMPLPKGYKKETVDET